MTSDPRWTDSDSEPDDGEVLGEDPRVIEVVEEYMQDLDAGRTPDRQSYLSRYPELAGAIRQCLEGLDLVRGGITGQKPQSSDMGSSTESTAEAGSHFIKPLGDFQILREIARGGMGVVYEAVQLSLGRRVALKVLPFAGALDEHRLQRFKNESQAAALLHHTHIVPIYAVGSDRGVHFYAMQLISGQSLAVVIEQLRQREGRLRPKEGASHVLNPAPAFLSTESARRRPRSSASMPQPSSPQPSESQPLPAAEPQAPESTLGISAAVTSGAKLASETYFRRICRLMVQAADALEHAHQAGVIHRDIKPGNLLIDPAANLWVTDFGLAQLQVDHGLTRSGDFLGTFRYMSPEQTSGQRTMLDHRTDIYSLGATFYELLTLEPVFPGETHQELLYAILHVEPHSPRHWNRAVPAELETIVLKALAKNPAERYQSAAALGTDIQHYLDHKPILARPPSLLDRFRKWSRRHPSIAIAGVLLLAVIAIASLVSNRMIVLEQQKTTAALDREKLRAQEAEKSFQQSRQAMDALFQISQEELAGTPADGARKRILEVVLGHYEDFIEQRRGDPASQAELTRVQSEVKEILEELNAIQREMQIRLLARDAVQRELGLAGDQEARLETLISQWEQERDAFFEEMRSLSEDARRSKLLATAHEHETALDELLRPDQLVRFRQIALQSLWLAAFKEPEVVKALELAPEQRSQIRDIEREMVFRPFRGGGPGPPEPPGPPPHERMRRDREEALAEVLKLLSRKQLARWEELTGRAFSDFGDGPFPGPPFGPPGRGPDLRRR